VVCVSALLCGACGGKDGARAAVPFLPAHALVHAASAGSLYYALVGVRLSVEPTQVALGVDLFSADPNPRLQQAGFSTRSPRRRESHVLPVAQSPSSGRAYWGILDARRLEKSTRRVPTSIGWSGLPAE
jgi:hypothetical protein